MKILITGDLAIYSNYSRPIIQENVVSLFKGADYNDENKEIS